MKKILWFILPIVIVSILWEFISRSGFINAALFPPPSKVIVALWGMVKSGTLLSDIRDSIWRLLLGLGIGSIVGICIGLITGRIKSVAKILNPIIQALRPLPPVAIIPLIIVWFGIDDSAKIFSIAFAVFFPVWLNTHIGAGRIAHEFLWSAKLLTRSSSKIFSKIIFPSALPFIIAGIRTSIAIAFVMVFVSELSGASSGLGYRISISSLAYRIDEMMAALIVLGALGALTDQLFVFSTNRIFPWIRFSTK
jgi:NitT/TauT family transport system permease protein